MNLTKLEPIYAGKAKTVYRTDNPDYLIMHFRDDISAFNGVKLEKLARKGAVNNQINAFIMQKLESAGIKTQFVECIAADESLVKALEMVKVECVVRNITAGNLCKRYGLQTGLPLNPPLIEFYLKDDGLGDPLVTEDHIRLFGWAKPAEIDEMKKLALQINDILVPLFKQANMKLVDYKLEFGRHHGHLVLGDEFSPDGCRIWDAQTDEILDKDRFRKDLGGVVEAYVEIANRLGVKLSA